MKQWNLLPQYGGLDTNFEHSSIQIVAVKLSTFLELNKTTTYFTLSE